MHKIHLIIKLCNLTAQSPQHLIHPVSILPKPTFDEYFV